MSDFEQQVGMTYNEALTYLFLSTLDGTLSEGDYYRVIEQDGFTIVATAKYLKDKNGNS
jgi:hypothetical protein